MTTHEAGLEPLGLTAAVAIIERHTGLAQLIEGHIERKAQGRIRDLHVVCLEDSVILTGRSRTYHAKQLAQEAALDLTSGRSTLANKIVVC